MEPYILTSKEATVLIAIGGEEAWLQELSAATRLTPTDVKNIIGQLKEKQLIELLDKQDFIRLTTEGQRVRNILKKQETNAPYSFRGPKQVVILPDKTVMRKDIESADSETLDRALDEELSKLAR